MNSVFAADNPFGKITPPITGYDTDVGGLIFFINNILRLVFIVAGLFALWKFIMAGFTFMGSEGDPKKLSQARDQILMTLVGLLVIAASFVIAAIAGVVFFGDATAIINPKPTGVGTQ